MSNVKYLNKTCTRCDRWLPRTAFKPRPKSKLTSWCTECLDAPPSTTKACCKCGEEKPLEQFAVRSDRSGGRSSDCRACRREYIMAWRLANPEKNKDNRPKDIKAKANRTTRLKTDYGLSWEQFEQMVEDQGGLCGICQRTAVSTSIIPRGSGIPRTVVDHDHVTGVVRGLLCVPCNLMLGYADDDVAILGRGIDYLKGHQGEA